MCKLALLQSAMNLRTWNSRPIGMLHQSWSSDTVPYLCYSRLICIWPIVCFTKVLDVFPNHNPLIYDVMFLHVAQFIFCLLFVYTVYSVFQVDLQACTKIYWYSGTSIYKVICSYSIYNNKQSYRLGYISYSTVLTYCYSSNLQLGYRMTLTF